jgi:hypothetical protein
MSSTAAPMPRARPALEGWRAALTEERRRRLLTIGSAVGWGLLIAAMVVLVLHDGGFGYDAYAYWLAGRNVLDGAPLYWIHDEGALGAYRYPPLFAQLWAPFTLMPALAFSWAWRIVCLLSLRYLAGSWRNVGLWGLVPLTWTELSIANVTFPTAALTFAALRGRAEFAAWAGALKIAPLLALPYFWIRKPHTRRALLTGLATVLAAVAVSFALSPDAWLLYLSALTWMTSADTNSFGVVALLPNGFLDALLRLSTGVALIVLAVWRGSDRFAFAATIIAVPVLAVWRLAPLLALPRLRAGSSAGDSNARQARPVGDAP